MIIAHPLEGPIVRRGEVCRPLRCAPALLALLACQAAVAQTLTLTERETKQRGNFAVGFGTTTDNGSYGLDLTTLETSFSNVGSDSGNAAAASASFNTAQAYTLATARLDFSGSSSTTVEAPPNVVSFADALSQLALVFVVSEATPFELQANIVEVPGPTVNNLAPRADAQFRLSGPGNSWLFSSSGSFLETGVLAAGTWRIDAFADARGNGDAGFSGTLLLAPVPEPAAWLLMGLGLVAIGLRRAAADAAIATQTWGTQP